MGVSVDLLNPTGDLLGVNVGLSPGAVASQTNPLDSLSSEILQSSTVSFPPSQTIPNANPLLGVSVGLLNPTGELLGVNVGPNPGALVSQASPLRAPSSGPLLSATVSLPPTETAANVNPLLGVSVGLLNPTGDLLGVNVGLNPAAQTQPDQSAEVIPSNIISSGTSQSAAPSGIAAAGQPLLGLSVVGLNPTGDLLGIDLGLSPGTSSVQPGSPTTSVPTTLSPVFNSGSSLAPMTGNAASTASARRNLGGPIIDVAVGGVGAAQSTQSGQNTPNNLLNVNVGLGPSSNEILGMSLGLLPLGNEVTAATFSPVALVSGNGVLSTLR